jgi:O-antigen/teichoic acid export membrane protein
MWAVHFVSKRIPESEYGALVTLLSLSMLMPGLPLQMVFAQQTAAALATNRQAQLARMLRMAWLGSFLVWLVLAGGMLCFQQTLIARWQLSNPAALWAALITWLGCLWAPMFLGALQGKQDFLSMGWSMILNSIGRLGGAAVIVLLLGGYATGIMTAVALGYALAVLLGIWQTREIWLGRGEAFEGRALLRQIVPLMLGFGACQFLFTADTMFVKAWFTEQQTAFYGAAGTLSRGVIWLAMPLAAVMFPKIVHSAVRSEKTDVMALTLVGTALLAAGGAVGLWVVGPWVVRLVYLPSYVDTATLLLPWYAGAMVPLSLANVLVNNLLARSQFRIVPWLVVLAIGYPIALHYFHHSLASVLQTMAAFCTVLFLVCAWFTWAGKSASASLPSDPARPGSA